MTAAFLRALNRKAVCRPGPPEAHVVLPARAARKYTTATSALLFRESLGSAAFRRGLGLRQRSDRGVPREAKAPTRAASGRGHQPLGPEEPLWAQAALGLVSLC